MKIAFRNENISKLPKEAHSVYLRSVLSFNPCDLKQQCVAGYCNADLQSSYLKTKSLDQQGFGSKHGHFLNFSIFLKLNLKLQVNVTLQLLCNPWIQSKLWRNVNENFSYTERKFVFQSYMAILSKLAKSVRNWQHFILGPNNQNWNLSFHYLLLKHKPCIKDKEFHDKEQKIDTNFYLLLRFTFNL